MNLKRYDLKGVKIDDPDSGGSGDDEPGGSGSNSGSGDGSDDDPEDKSILTDFINSLKEFAKSIGTLFSGLLSGLISLFDSLLASVSAFSEFIGAVLAFIPPEILSILVAGLTLSIVLAVVRFIRG